MGNRSSLKAPQHLVTHSVQHLPGLCSLLTLLVCSQLFKKRLFGDLRLTKSIRSLSCENLWLMTRYQWAHIVRDRPRTDVTRKGQPQHDDRAEHREKANVELSGILLFQCIKLFACVLIAMRVTKYAAAIATPKCVLSCA